MIYLDFVFECTARNKRRFFKLFFIVITKYNIIKL